MRDYEELSCEDYLETFQDMSMADFNEFEECYHEEKENELFHCKYCGNKNFCDYVLSECKE